MSECTKEERALLDALREGKNILEARRAVWLARLRDEPELADELSTVRRSVVEAERASDRAGVGFDRLREALGCTDRDWLSSLIWEAHQ